MTDTPEMVERAAHLIALEICEATAADRASWEWPEAFSGDTIDRARSCARAVIEAMREPTEVMVLAAPAVVVSPSMKVGGSLSVTADPAQGWRAMIDAALGKEPS